MLRIFRLGTKKSDEQTSSVKVTSGQACVACKLHTHICACMVEGAWLTEQIGTDGRI